MTLMDAIRTLREARGLTFEHAYDEAIRYFVRKGLPLPDWALAKAKRIGAVK